ncbi:hypothetical protein F511_34623 [Dorcoceras hygrometricum]|uniref:Uncharacterized protein n=1 Tax=Dorcoceras hygrometricum TaxID=472368 RepID=A0A2Z7CJ85_9LAMI|nr:hypothetical protein F511_34623 [Dorcoceras hygrometricum]
MVQRSRLNSFGVDLSHFSAKFLCLGLRNRVLLFPALSLLQYHIRLSYCIRSDTSHCCSALDDVKMKSSISLDDVTTVEIFNKLG